MSDSAPAPLSTNDDLLAGLSLDPDSGQHLYRQVSQGLARLIRAQRFAPRTALPSERVLAERLGISRITARKAIDALVAPSVTAAEIRMSPSSSSSAIRPTLR